MAYIEQSLASLARFKGVSFEDFHSNPDNFRIAFYDLHIASEAVLDIGGHILSRIPGTRPSSYKDIPRLLGQHGIVAAEFASNQLHKMAGYRNRMVHFYSEIGEREIYGIIQEELDNFNAFLSAIAAVLRRPSDYRLTLE